MIVLSVIVTAGLLSISCDGPTLPSISGTPGSANITVRIGKVGSLAKLADISFAMLCVRLSAPGETNIFDTIALSGNGSTTVAKPYDDLASLKA